MARTTEVLISYDIEDNKTRTHIYNRLLDVGMLSIQKSVMWGRLLPADISLAKRILERELKDSDKAFLMVSPLTSYGVFYGKQPDFKGYDDHDIF